MFQALSKNTFVYSRKAAKREEAGKAAAAAAAEAAKPVVMTVSKPVEPPTELKLIIDKMASYVVRNGEDFEELMRGKKDRRFSFLESEDRHNPYYLYVKSTTRLDLEEEEREEEQQDEDEAEEEKPKGEAGGK